MNNSQRWPVAIVCHSKTAIVEKQHAFDPTAKRFRFIKPGMTIAGYRFTDIIVTRDAHVEMTCPEYSSDTVAERAQQWFRDCVEVRLLPPGKVVCI